MKKNTNNISVAPTISPDILKTISVSSAIKTFGSQLKDEAKEKIISSPRGKIAQLQSEKIILEKEVIVAGLKYDAKVKQIEINKSQYPTEELYQKDLLTAKSSYETTKKSLELQIEQKDILIQNVNNNPYDQIKNNQKKIDNAIKAFSRRNQNFEIKSKKDLIKQLASNTTKTLAPILALQLTNNFLVLISQRKKLEELVDEVNNYIETQVKDETTVTIATNLRNNAITLINNNINKLQKIQSTLNYINLSITIFSALIPLLKRLAPFVVISTPPGTPIPGMILHDELRDRKFKLERLVAGLGPILSIGSSILSNEIIELIELKALLEEINLKLDNKTLTNLNEQQLTDLSNTFLPVGVTEFPPYKGFKFNIKEEQNPQFVVKGNKRRYAVAIDRYNVEVLKSEYSFTLDPNDLIEQLKLVIDQQNLQG